MNTIKIKNYNNLVKDTSTKAILNSDIHGLNEAKRKKRESITLKTLTQEVNTIKNEFEEIKTLLKQIARK